jgi:hypothetical protein
MGITDLVIEMASRIKQLECDNYLLKSKCDKLENENKGLKEKIDND